MVQRTPFNKTAAASFLSVLRHFCTDIWRDCAYLEHVRWSKDVILLRWVGNYRVGIDDSNRICALAIDIIGNGGVSPARGTMIKGLLNGAMSYGAVEHIRLALTVVKSNLQRSEDFLTEI